MTESPLFIESSTEMMVTQAKWEDWSSGDLVGLFCLLWGGGMHCLLLVDPYRWPSQPRDSQEGIGVEKIVCSAQNYVAEFRLLSTSRPDQISFLCGGAELLFVHSRRFTFPSSVLRLRTKFLHSRNPKKQASQD